MHNLCIHRERYFILEPELYIDVVESMDWRSAIIHWWEKQYVLVQLYFHLLSFPLCFIGYVDEKCKQYNVLQGDYNLSSPWWQAYTVCQNPSSQQIRLNYFNDWQTVPLVAKCKQLRGCVCVCVCVCVCIKCSSIGEMYFTENSIHAIFVEASSVHLPWGK